MFTAETDNILQQIETARELGRSGKLKESNESLKSILSYCKQINFERGIADASYAIGNNYDKLETPEKAVEYCSAALPVYVKLNEGKREAYCCLILSKAYADIGDTSKQAEFLFRGLEKSIAVKDLLLQHKFYNNAANYYQNILNDLNKAIEFVKISSEIASEINDNYGVCVTNCNLGNMYAITGEYDKALAHLKIAEDVNADGLNNEILSCYIIMFIGTVYWKQKKFDIALECFERVVNLAIKNNNWGVYGECVTAMGETYHFLGRTNDAIRLYKSAVEILREKGMFRLLITVYSNFSELYEKLEKYDEALHYHELFRSTRIEHLSLLNKKNLENIKIVSHLHESQKESEILKEKNAELFEINRQLIEVDKEKNDFLGVVVHDLKNPLTNIILIAGNIKRNFEKLASEKKINSFEKIFLTSQRMLQIIDSLLDINKIESGNITLHPEEINVKTLLENIISEFETYSTQKNVKVNLIGEANAEVLNNDAVVIKEILINLISNALKYSHKDSEVKISYYKNTDTKTVFEITDNGLGIKEEEKSRVFQKFARISNKPTAGENSTGLGLSIVKKLTELAGGEISFESEFGKGTTFKVTF
ncbi:MAG: tetratricopeptide repeat-containing sensor histidine kinase [Bacteroidetes bacterium]|nr:tetratricopeptide repeat-containing sensor histidine kinase [Bacteroidota bacterium]